MRKIDDATGLPELPEGYFWRVEKQSVSIMEKRPDTEWYATYSPSPHIEPGREYRDAVSTVTRKAWGLFPVTRTVVSKETRIVNRSQAVVTQKTEETGEKYTVRGTIRYDNIRMPDQEFKLHKDLTREDLIPLCEKALEKFDNRKLLGDYPPKKLEA